MASSHLKRVGVMLCVFLIVWGMGCSRTKPIADTGAKFPLPEKETVVSEFILGVGDTIDVAVFRNRESEHEIWMGDTIDIQVYRNDDLDKNIRLGPSGRLMLPLIGDVEAAGKTALELRNEIRGRLASFIIDPQVTVAVTPNPERKIEALALTVKINATGRIFFPLAGELQAAGKSLFRLQEEMQEKLSDRLIDPQVVLFIKEIESRKILVLGEVNNPGVFSPDSAITLVEAIARASGTTRNAELSNVILVRKDAEQKIQTYDLKETFENGLSDQNILLSGDDIIYVPEKRISGISRYFDYLTAILTPFVNLERGIILWPAVKDVLKEGGSSSVNIEVR